ncbi:MAG: sensor histidine kinase [Bacillota bacterium]
MHLYRGNQYILLFFVYGLAFYSMGISALIQNTKGDSNFPLLKSIKYLGYFGIIHGMAEWILMIMIAQIYPEFDVMFIELAIIANAISFTFLCVFGIKLLEYNERINRIIKLIPWYVFFLWLGSYSMIPLFHRGDVLSKLWVQSATSRYFIGFPASVITAIALYRNAKTIRNMDLTRLALKVRAMALLFAVYAVLAGIIVKRVNFFPANIINKELFYQVFNFPVEFGRTVVAAAITLLFIGIIAIFQWETNKKIAILTEQQAASRERRRLGQELHDVILQDLFVVGLQLENMIEDNNCSTMRQSLLDIKDILNSTIHNIRGFIGKVSSRKMEIEDLKYRIFELVHNFEKTYDVHIALHYEVPDVTLGHLSSEKLTQIYYIIQEAINNAMKHAHATKFSVTLNTTLKYVVATVYDDGQGFDISTINDAGGYGLFSMRERAKSVHGILEIDSSQKGTVISLSIPWEEYHDGNEKH